MKKLIFLAAMVMAAAPLLNGCAKETAQDDDVVITEDAGIGLEQEIVSEGMDNAVDQNQAVPIMENADMGMPAMESAVTIEKPTNEHIQQALKNAGLYEGAVDGKIGPKTKKAIQDFQSQNGLKVDGKVGPKTWEKLAPYLGRQEVILPEPTVSN